MNFLESSSPKKYKITGSANFSVDVSIQGQLPSHTSVISLTSFSKNNRNDVLGCDFKWFRQSDCFLYHLSDLNSNTYVVSPVDIGYRLSVEVRPKEEGFFGVLSVDFGVIKLDPGMRNTLEGILTVGGSSFPAKIKSESEGNGMGLDVSVLLSTDTVRIVRNWDQESLKFGYSTQSPGVEIATRDLNELTLVFSETDIQGGGKLAGVVQNRRLSLKMASRISRDLLLLSLKCFSIKNYLTNSKILSSLENTSNSDPGRLFREKDSENPLVGDLFLELRMLKEENSMLMDQNKLLKGEKEAFSKQIADLEQEIIETIDTYTKLIAEIKENPESSSKIEENLFEISRREQFAKKRRSLEVQELENSELNSIKRVLFKDEKENQISDLRSQNAKLMIEITGLREELMGLKSSKDSVANYQEMSIKMEVLAKENVSLKQTQQKYFELLSKYRELDDNNSFLSKKLAALSVPNSGKFEIMERELAREKENNKKLADDLKLLGLQFNNYRKNAGGNNSFTGENESELSAINKQLNKKIESLQKELESKGNSLIIEQLTKTNAKFMLENQKLIEELQRKTEEVSLQYSSNRHGDVSLFAENQELRMRIKVLEQEKDKLLVEYSKIRKN